MDDTDKIIEEDKKQHPKCGYRKQFSKECRSMNGRMDCKQIEQLFRICSGKRPVEIHRKEISGNDDIYDNNYYDMDDEGEEDQWPMDNRSFDFDMQQAYENQVMGLMQLAGMMMGAAMMNPYMDETGENDYEAFARSRNPFYDDTAPIPHNSNTNNYNPRREANMEPSFVAPHSNRDVNASQQSSSKRTSVPHRYSDYEDKTREF